MHAPVPEKQPARVLVVSEDLDLAPIRSALEGAPEPLTVPTIANPDEALALQAGALLWHDVILTTHGRASRAALDLRQEHPERTGTVPILVLVPHGDDAAAVQALADGADGILTCDLGGAWLHVLQGLAWQLVRRAEDRRARALAEEKARERQKLFDAFMRNSPAIAYLKREDGRYAWVNACFERLFGLEPEDWRDRTDADLWGAEAAVRIRENDAIVLSGGQALEIEEQVPQQDGTHYWLAFKFPLTDGQGSRFVGGMAVDVTPLRRAEADRRVLADRVAHARRLETLGTLSASIGHDFNNLLVSILGNAALARMELPPDSPSSRLLERIEQSAMRAADLTSQLMNVSGRGSLLLETIDLTKLVEESSFGLRARLPAGVRLRLELDGTPRRVQADARQLRQVITTLVTRAAEAFAGEGGTIILRTGMGRLFRRDLGRLYLAESLSEGMYAHVEVEDDGPALTVEAQERLFEPGDTVSPGGLELAAVLGIVRGHGGALEVATEEIRGTRVRVCLPPAGAFEVEEPVHELPEPQGAVLVIDDEEQVRSVARLTLQRFGWPCMVARSGEEGIALFAEHSDGIAVVLLDVSLPGLSGAETLERLRQLKTDVKVVLSSGYEASEALRGITVGKDVSFLRKPWRPTALLKVLRESIEGR